MMARSMRSSSINRITPRSPKRKRLFNRIPQSPTPYPLNSATDPQPANLAWKKRRRLQMLLLQAISVPA